MSSIQSNVGLISGIPIQDTVDQLIQVAARPRNLISQRVSGFQSERNAVDTLSALVLGLRSSLNRFNSTKTFNSREATSSNKDALSASVASGKTPKAGSYTFTPLQTASAHQLVSSSFEDLSDALGTGTLDFRIGGHVNKGIALSNINGGAGFEAGQLRITDRTGATSVIDLRAARTVDDVLSAINSDSTLNVTASTEGDAFTLTDNTTGTGSLTVAEVGSGTTAASLGLAGLSTSTSDPTVGSDIFRLYENTKLSSLNDGVGIRISDSLTNVDDLTFSLADGTTGGVDLSGAETLGDLIDAINNDLDIRAKVQARISADGNRIEVEDITVGSGTFAVTNGVIGTAAEDLGLTGTASGAVITGDRLVSGLRDTLVSSLNGGRGYGELGAISITDRDGNPAVNVDLSGAETLGEIVSAINGSGANVTAAINASRNGIAITDTSGGTGSLVIADADAQNTATTLGFAVDDTVSSVNSGTLNRQVVSESSLLTSLNGGAGIALGDFFITDSSGNKQAVDLNTLGSEAKTLGDVIDRINALDNDVVATINEAGDGLLITDTAEGEGTLTITEVGNGTTAADLRILGASSATNGNDEQFIDGSSSYSIDLSDLEQTSESLSLETVNGGEGIDKGIFQVFTSSSTDAREQFFIVDLGRPGEEAFTVGDVIDKINEAAEAGDHGVVASLNSSGTGIKLTDTEDGPGNLRVVNVGNDTTADDLRLTATAGDTNDDGEQSIDGAGLFSAIDAEQGALQTLAERVNDLEAGVSASVINDGVGYRLSFTADNPGAANELLFDTSSLGFSLSEISRPQNAALLFGGTQLGGGIAVTSDTNEFNDLVDGLDITISEVSESPITVQVTNQTQPLVDVVQDFVDAYNSIRSNIDSVADFDAESNTTGILFGSSEVLSVENDLSNLITSRFFVGGEFSSLVSIGIGFDEGGTGKLSLDTGRLNEAIAENAVDIEALFTKEGSGVVDKFKAVVDRLAGGEFSLLTSRSESLSDSITTGEERIEAFNERLDKQRDRLLLEFFNLETTLSSLQSNLSTLDAIVPISIGNRSSS